MKAYRLKITGKVQGVWFRESTRAKALELGIKGFVRNEKDGSVYVEAVGDDEAMADFIKWCKEGPELAEVENIIIEEKEVGRHEGFEVMRN